MSKKTKKYLKIFTVLVVIVIGFHFVPVYSQTGHVGGYADPETGISSDLCIGYSHFNNRTYRVITGGFNQFRIDKKLFHPSDNVYDSDGCAEPIHLRLYIF